MDGRSPLLADRQAGGQTPTKVGYSNVIADMICVKCGCGLLLGEQSSQVRLTNTRANQWISRGYRQITAFTTFEFKGVEAIRLASRDCRYLCLWERFGRCALLSVLPIPQIKGHPFLLRVYGIDIYRGSTYRRVALRLHIEAR